MTLRRHIEQLSRPRNPVTHPQAHRAAQAYIASTLRALGREVQVDNFPTQIVSPDGRSVEGLNILALPQFKGPATFLVVAHYDTVDHSPGADDNGSAVALALEIAAQCPRVAVLFTDLEEQDLLGARHFVASEQLSQVPTLVLESLGFWSEEKNTQRAPRAIELGFPQIHQWLENRHFKGNFWALLALERDLGMASTLTEILGQDCLLIPVPNAVLEPESSKELRDFGRSDHLAFWEAGRSCLMLTDTANFRNPNYHQTSDTVDTLNFPQMRRLSSRLQQFLS